MERSHEFIPSMSSNQWSARESAAGHQPSAVRACEAGWEQDPTETTSAEQAGACPRPGTQEYQDNLRSKVLRVVPARRPRQCKHVKSNGEFCGSPALRGRNYCYFHLTHIGRRLRAARNQARATSPEGAAPLELPPFEDAGSIQIGLMQVVDALLHNRIDAKRAGLVLYALQTASSILARGASFECRSGATVAGGYDEFEEDYELGEDVPELKTDEAAEEQEAAQQESEEIAKACARVEEARKEVDVEERFRTLEDGTQVFTCEPVTKFMCKILGPLAGAPAPADERDEREVREAPSQRLELLSPRLGKTGEPERPDSEAEESAVEKRQAMPILSPEEGEKDGAAEKNCALKGEAA